MVILAVVEAKVSTCSVTKVKHTGAVTVLYDSDVVVAVFFAVAEQPLISEQVVEVIFSDAVPLASSFAITKVEQLGTVTVSHSFLSSSLGSGSVTGGVGGGGLCPLIAGGFLQLLIRGMGMQGNYEQINLCI